MATSLDFASGLPTVHTAMGCVESKPDGFSPMKPQVRVVHRGSSDIFMTIEFRAVEATCRRVMGNA
jgi:hypothetical protein